MTDIFVSDLFGYNIDNNTPFIIINTKESHKLLHKIAEADNTSIWEYNKHKINDILKSRNVDHKKFLPLGHVLYKQNFVPNTLILGNIQLCKKPSGLKEISTYGNGKLYLPVDNENKYTALGLVHLHNNSQIPNICLIPKELVTMLNKFSGDTGKLIVNEYNLISHESSRFPSIVKSELVSDDLRDIKLISTSNKYLAMSHGNNKAELRVKQNTENQNLSYNAQGELIIGDKCLTYSGGSLPVYFEKCDDNNRQKWNLNGKNIVSRNDITKCLTSEENELYVKNCSDEDSQHWDTEGSDNVSHTDYSWDKYQGKTVALVESDNPWYINQNDTVQMKYGKDQKIYTDIKYRNNADYVSDFAYDMTRPDVGLGYSYADHQGVDCKKIEKFDGFKDDNQLVFIILLILFAIVVWRIWLK